MDKVTIEQFFRTKRAIEVADFIVVRIEENNGYYVYKSKSRLANKGDIITEIWFKEILSTSLRPMILSNIYIDLKEML